MRGLQIGQQPDFLKRCDRHALGLFDKHHHLFVLRMAFKQVLVQQLQALGCSFIHVSSGGVSPQQKIALGPNYQVGFASEIRKAVGMPTVAVGLITEAQQAEAILQAGDADLIALARAFLYQPRWGWQAAAALGGQVQAHPAYWRCLPRDAQAAFGKVTIGGR